MNIDEKSQKQFTTYWEEFRPLWWIGIKSWFGWGDWKQALTSLLMFVGTVSIYLYVEEFEWAIENIAQFFIAILIGGLWLLIVTIISFISSNIILYKNKQGEILKKQVEIDNLTENAELKIGTIPDLFPLFLGKNNKKKYIGLEIHNLSKDKKILELGVFSHAIFGHRIENGKLGDGVLPREDFTWTENSSQIIELRPDGKAKAALLFVSNDNKVMIGDFSQKAEEETLFEMELIFRGRYEGETHFREHKEIRCIYCSKEGISFSNSAVLIFLNISHQMTRALEFINEGNLYVNRPYNFEANINSSD